MNKDTIVAYIAQGFQASKVASILGCSEAYISEVQTEDWFPSALAEAKTKIKRNEDETKLEDDYIKLESKVLTDIREQMPFADFKDLVRLTEVLIRRKQTAIPTGGIVFNQQNNTVLLQIPSAVAPEIVLNNKKEVVAIGNQTLAPMPIHGVRKLFEHIKNEREGPTQIEQAIAEGRILEHVPEDF